jgi:hypothetical protein
MNIEKFLIAVFFCIGLMLGLNGALADKAAHCQDFGKMKIYGEVYECKKVGKPE